MSDDTQPTDVLETCVCGGTPIVFKFAQRFENLQYSVLCPKCERRTIPHDRDFVISHWNKLTNLSKNESKK